MSINWFKYASPASFYPLAGKSIPWFLWTAVLLSAAGLYWGFFKTPHVLTDQKEYYRIIFVHVPAAWLAMWLYIVLVGWAVIGLIFNTRLSYMLAAAIAPTGAMFTFLSLWTGAFWGKTSWGTWWDWDPRMTSQLILLFLYIGYMALQSAIDDTRRADRASALLAIVGLVLVPIIFWSINCPDPNQCAALHQRSSLKTVEANILIAMLVMTLAFWSYSFGVIFMRLRNLILERERNSKWVKAYVEETS
ncbi:MAG TPA: heme ABC transporter permease [Chromatiales bacterium]|nr:heme ABC transporter permease [Thiotrichales bacterium]HIP66984.1 heme ABC transporter permease [Chromatiales bacterium]